MYFLGYSVFAQSYTQAGMWFWNLNLTHKLTYIFWFCTAWFVCKLPGLNKGKTHRQNALLRPRKAHEDQTHFVLTNPLWWRKFLFLVYSLPVVQHCDMGMSVYASMHDYECSVYSFSCSTECNQELWKGSITRDDVQARPFHKTCCEYSNNKIKKKT